MISNLPKLLINLISQYLTTKEVGVFSTVSKCIQPAIQCGRRESIFQITNLSRDMFRKYTILYIINDNTLPLLPLYNFGGVINVKLQNTFALDQSGMCEMLPVFKDAKYLDIRDWKYFKSYDKFPNINRLEVTIDDTLTLNALPNITRLSALFDTRSGLPCTYKFPEQWDSLRIIRTNIKIPETYINLKIVFIYNINYLPKSLLNQISCVSFNYDECYLNNLFMYRGIVLYVNEIRVWNLKSFIKPRYVIKRVRITNVKIQILEDIPEYEYYLYL